MTERRPWDRQPGEKPKPWAAFRIYRDLGKGRSQDLAYCRSKGLPDGSKTAPGFYSEWSSANDWTVRAAAYDAHLDAIAQEAAEKATAAQAAENARLREAAKADELAVADELVARARAMMNFPLQRQERSVDGTQVTIEPVKWHQGHVATYLELASKLRRLALGMETDRAKIDVEIDRELEAIFDVAASVLPQEWMDALMAALEARAKK